MQNIICKDDVKLLNAIEFFVSVDGAEFDEYGLFRYDDFPHRFPCLIVADKCSSESRFYYDGVEIARYNWDYERLFILPWRLSVDVCGSERIEKFQEFMNVSFIQAFIVNYFLPRGLQHDITLEDVR